MALLLEVLDYTDPTRWRWRLSEADTGSFVADEEVRLDPDAWQFEAFVDLANYLRFFAAPDRRTVSEAQLVDAVGAWIGSAVFGGVGRAIVDHGPAPVRLQLPRGTEGFLGLPFELAHVGGRPLALQGISFVLELAGWGSGAAREPVGDRLRMLAAFSVPTNTSALALRRERQELSRRLAAIEEVAVELRVLQYGVTSERLADILSEGEGWDIVHFSGHALGAGLALERSDGSLDTVAAGAFGALLEPARGRLKLLTLSSCELGPPLLPELASLASPLADPVPEDDRPLPLIGSELAEKLGCAVLAARFPAVEGFAIELHGGVYERLIRDGVPLPRALSETLREVLEDPANANLPPLSLAVPALVGPAAAELRLNRPTGSPVMVDYEKRRGDLPPAPNHFVGRVGAMTRANAALAPRSDSSGVLFVGMAGVGKTWCALELAHGRESSFERIVWYAAPEEGSDVSGALMEFAYRLEQQLPGLKLTHAVEDEDELRSLLPRLSILLERRRILFVLDNLETLLTQSGTWRNPRWPLLLDAFLDHHGASRVVLTSQLRPAGLSPRVLELPVHALPLAEAELLAHELPNLRRLLDGTAPDFSRDAGRALLTDVLLMSQGHPKLIAIADGLAANPRALAARVAEVGEIRLAAEDAPLPDEAGFLQVLDRWTRYATDELSADSKLLFGFLCCLEPDDRVEPVLSHNWGDVVARIDGSGSAPDFETALEPLAARALVDVERGDWVAYRVHPVVAASGRAVAGETLQDAVDVELAMYWGSVLQYGLDRESEKEGGTVVRAGRRAVPYLLRQGAWADLVAVGAIVLHRDPSPRTTAALLPALQQAVDAAQGTDGEASLRRLVARALAVQRPRDAEDQYRWLLAHADETGDHELAGIVSSDLIGLLTGTGRLQEALQLADHMADQDRRAGMGPWTRLMGEAQRLQILGTLGNYVDVLAHARELVEEMAALPERSGEREAAEPFSVRELILDSGREAALRLGRWADALDFNRKILTSMEQRGAPARAIAQAEFNDYSPLLAVNRPEDARELLYRCRARYEQEGDVDAVAATVSALADVELAVGRLDEAWRLEADALRLKYAVGTPKSIAVSHSNYADILERRGAALEERLAHRLAAAVISFQTTAGELSQEISAVAADLAGSEAPLAPTWKHVCDLVALLEGVRLDALVAELPDRAPNAQAALDEVLRLARETPLADIPGMASHIAAWEPVISALVAARNGNRAAAHRLEVALSARAEMPDWRALSRALQRLAAGEAHGTPGELDAIDRAIYARALDASAGRVNVAPDAWEVLSDVSLEDALMTVAAAVVAAVGGDDAGRDEVELVTREMEDIPDLRPLARVLRRILDGERSTSLLDGLAGFYARVAGGILATLAERDDVAR